MAKKTEKKNEAKRQSYHHGDLRQALVTVGVEILEKDGLEALSLRRVAREAGVSQAAPYAHFKDKRALLEAIAEVGFAELAESMAREAKEASTTVDKRLAFGVGYVVFAVKNPALFRLMFGPEICDFKSDSLMTVSAKSYDMIHESTEQQLAEASEVGTPEHVKILTTAAWASVHGLAHLLVDGRLQDIAEGVGGFKELTRQVLIHG